MICPRCGSRMFIQKIRGTATVWVCPNCGYSETKTP